MTDDTSSPAPSSSSPTGPSIAGRIAKTPVPLWAVGVVVLVLLIVGAFGYFGKSSVSLGDAVPDARSIEVQLVICNEVVDDRGINPRSAELSLARTFENDFDVEKATVAIDRIDCDDD